MKQITAMMVGLALFIPAVVGAQTISTFELQELLAQDRQQLVALNGEDAVRAHIFSLLLLLAQQQGITVGSTSNVGDVDVETLSPRDIEDDSVVLRGELQEGDNTEVWFAFSRTDSTPSCTSSNQRVHVDGRYDDRDDFSKRLRNLDEDERYYYRACSEDDDRRTISGDVERFTTDDDNGNDEEPDVDIEEADNIERTSAELNGSVDMNDFRNGIVFFLWGEDEDEVEDATDEDEYDDIDEDGDDLQKQRVDSDLDGEDDFSLDIRNLDRNTDHYFALCVEYEDEDDDETLECSSIEEFETDN